MSDLAARLDRFAAQRLLCVGDVMLDRYVYGTVDRISPEAPIPVLHTKRETATLGGAGNVVRNIAALGGKIDIIGVIGADDSGKDLHQAFAALPDIGIHLLCDPTRPTTQKTRYVAHGQQMLRADSEVATAIDAAMEQQILDEATQILKNVGVVILSDYAKGVLTPRVTTDIIKLARDSAKTVIIDPKGRDLARYKGATYLTPNRKELSDMTGKAILSVADAESAARPLLDSLNVDHILVKLGADGVCLIGKNKPALHLYTKAREVFDVSGAGDTVAATLALSLASGFTAAEAAELANIAGSIVVGKVGTACVSRGELAHELLHGSAQRTQNKMIDWTGIADIAERWRKQGLKVGFTNGCFDLLHPGHIALLRQARSACDRLIVGLNSDASVKRLKGETRPIQNEAARGTVLASLTDVDHIVVFDQDTPLEIIKTIRPDILIKGADYTIDKVVGAKEVQGWGGTVVLANLVEGQSTTNTIAKMKQ